MEEDQITSVPSDLEKKPARVKDPKKVAAGKALAKKNKEARDLLKKNREAGVTPLNFLDVSNGLQISAGVIGSFFVIYHAYNFFYPKETGPLESRGLPLPETNTIDVPKKVVEDVAIDMD